MPRVAAVHDLSGYGLCSLTVVLPVLTAMQVDVCPLPTAYLSSHTGYEGFTFADMTDQMEPALAHWQALGLRFDAVYSGFLGSAAQIACVEKAVDLFQPTVVLVDPVMGDDGKIYRTYTPEMCNAMKRLADRATLLTPNLTEAAILLDRDPAAIPADADLRGWLEQLAGGKRDVVLTGLRDGGSVTTLCYNYQSGHTDEITRPFVRHAYHGTGDLFAAVLLGWLLRGRPLPDACGQAAEFVYRAAEHTAARDPDTRDIAFAGQIKLLI